MDENKIQNSVQKSRGKYLIDWGVSLETAETIDVIGDLLNKTSYDINDKTNVGQSLLIGIMQQYNPEFRKLTEGEIKGFINDGFQIRQVRKRKRLKTGIITKNSFEVEFSNGDEIFYWLMDNKILKKINLIKGYLKGLSEEQKVLIRSIFPETAARILAILGMSQAQNNEPKAEYLYQKEGIGPWRNL